jgi:hypothetical protein
LLSQDNRELDDRIEAVNAMLVQAWRDSPLSKWDIFAGLACPFLIPT